MFTRKSASLYFSVRWLLSRMTWMLTPRLCASTSALAMGAEMKLYAWTRMLVFGGVEMLADNAKGVLQRNVTVHRGVCLCGILEVFEVTSLPALSS